MSESSPKHDYVLDSLGLLCPEPVMMLHAMVRKAKAGEVIKVLASDPSTQRDIPKFCQFLGHQLMHSCASEETFLYWIKKAK